MGSSLCLTWVITRARQHKSTLTRPLCQPGNKSVTQSACPVSQPSWQQTRQVGPLGGQTSRIQDAGRSVTVAVSQIISQKEGLWGTDVNQSGGFHTVSISRAGQHKKHKVINCYSVCRVQRQQMIFALVLLSLYFVFCWWAEKWSQPVNRFQKGVWLYVSIWKNDPTSQLIYYLRDRKSVV